MKERPILFTGEMVRAILDGRKTQMRRLVRKQKYPHGTWATPDEVAAGYAHDTRAFMPPLGAIGDRLWVVTIKDIPGWEGLYGAGDDGEVYSIRNGIPKRLKSSLSGRYKRVSLCKSGGQRMMTVHEAVCRAFYGAPSMLRLGTANPEVRHLDGNSLNNTPANLDWGTASQNWGDRKCAGRGIHEEHHNAKLSMGIAKEMRASGKTAWALAKQYGVSPKTVRNVLRGLTWVDYGSLPANLPRWASRIDLKITAVRVERVADITEEDAKKEAITESEIGRLASRTLANYKGIQRAPLVLQFADLWQSRYGNWDANPFVWVYSIKLIKP